MYNYIQPQFAFTEQKQKAEKYIFDALDVNAVFVKSVLDSFDKFSNNNFTTYTSSVKNLVDSNIANAKEIVRTGKIECPSYGKNSV
jgi:hypothetical protein